MNQFNRLFRARIAPAIIIVAVAYLVSFGRDSFVPEMARSVVRLACFSNGKAAKLGTGVLMWDYKTSGKDIVLVSNQHVLKGCDSARVTFGIESWVAEIGSLTKTFPLMSGSTRLWVALDDSVDVAAIRLQFDPAVREIIGSRMLPTSLMIPRDSLSIGEDVLYLGYPYGMSERISAYPVLRQGIISLIDRTERQQGTFYVEAQALPGNSGGPVYRRTFAEWSDSLKTFVRVPERFVGIMAAYRSEMQEFFDLEGNVRVGLPLHTGLSVVYDVDTITRTMALLP